MMVGRTVTVEIGKGTVIEVEVMGEILVPLEIKNEQTYDFQTELTCIVAVTRYLSKCNDGSSIIIDPQDITKFI